MLLLSVSTKKRKHNWEITKRDLTKLTSPSVQTKNDWSRRASAQKIGYLNSRTLRSVRLCFFLPSHGGVKSFAPVKGSPPSLFQCSQGLKNTKDPLSRFFEAAPETHTTMRRLAHTTVAVRFSVSRVFFCSFDTAHAACLLPLARTKCASTVLADGTRKNATLTTGESVA